MSQSIIIKYRGLEILCKPGSILPYRNGKMQMSDVVMTGDNIYKDVKKGNIASDKDIIKAFGEKLELTNAIEIMLQKGDFQMTTKERQELNQKRRLKLLEYFHHNYVNPETNFPHPLSRYETVFNQIKAKVNYEMPFDKNCEEIRKAIIGILPIKPKTSNVVFQPTNKQKQSNNMPNLKVEKRKGKKFGK